jgi:hypothetical protein
VFELILLIAIAYAGARGVEKVTGTDDRRYDTAESRKTVEKVAASSPKGGSTKVVKAPGPTEPGGTFSAAAPRSAKIGGKAAVPLAVITETGSTMWKAVGEGYRERWPEIREEHRRKMAEKAEARRKKKEEAEAKKKADEAAAKAGPPPPYPPKPTDPPTAGASDTEVDDPDAKAKPEEPKTSDGDAKTTPAPTETAPEPTGWPGDGSSYLERELRKEEDRRLAAEAKAEAARKEAEETRDRAATDKVLAAQKEAREAKERADAAEERAARTAEAETDPAGRRHLSVVPEPAQNGDPMSSPNMVIPEIRTLDGLMNALTLTKAMCEMRSEEAIAIAADDKSLSDRLDQIEAEMAEMEVDAKTRQEIDTLREDIHTQSAAAAQYGAAAKDAGDFAVAAAASAYKAHGGIAEAVQSSPIERAAQAGYYDR